MTDCLRAWGHAFAACTFLTLSMLLGIDGQPVPAVLFGAAAIGAVDAAAFAYEVRAGRRRDPRVAELEALFGEVQEKAECAVAKSSELAVEYLERAQAAEAAAARAGALLESWQRLDSPGVVISVEDAAGGLRDALVPLPEPPPCTCSMAERCAQCPPEEEPTTGRAES
ncbi:hypothetical protein [Streptomyces sp. PR69]|uniref:hypothetical protein n=1 Tax=Streptomyces sp. PR69 TaxID=2984950 RepID=UPI0022655201|nr:hypothetical protein [Streptomyces sp. PR69]